MKRLVWKGRADLANRNGEEHGSITPYQFTTIIVGAIIGVGVLAFPRIIMEPAGSGGPLATLLGAIPVFVTWPAWVALSRWFPGRTPAEYAPRVLTAPVAWLVLAALAALQAILSAITVREFGEVLKAAVLPNTPIEVTISLGLLSTAYFVRFDLQVIARVYEVFFPIMLIPLTIIGLLSLTNARGYYLLPVTGMSWQGVVNGAALASVGSVASLVAPFLLPSLNRPKEAIRAGFWGFGLSLFIYLLAVTATLSVFGPMEVKRLVWPTFELIKTTTVPGFILERLESAFIGIWVAAVFTTVAATYYPLVLLLAQWFRLKDHKVAVIPLIPILYMIALIPDDIYTLYQWVTGVGLFGVVLTKGMAVVMVIVAYLRGKGAAGRAHQAP
jgi:spore germination protein